MDEQARLHLQRFADAYREAAPEGWVRIVTWWAKMGESPEEASLDATMAPAVVVLRDRSGFLVQEPIEPMSEPLQDLIQLEALDQRHADWLVMRVEIDADDPEPRAEFDHDTLVRAETSLQDPWADEVHHYLERHREELQGLPVEPTTEEAGPALVDVPGVHEIADRIVDGLTGDHSSWIRVVMWIGRLQQEDGSTAPNNVRLNRVITWDGAQLAAEYGRTSTAHDAIEALYEAAGGVDWTQLRLIADRDGPCSVVAVMDEPRRPEEGAATDPYWRQVHDYLELNQDEVEALVERLQDHGNLPGDRSGQKRAGLLGWLRRRG